MRVLKGGIAAMAVAALVAMPVPVAALVAMPVPVAAKPDKEDIARALAALAILGVAVAKARNDPDGWDEDRYGDPFSPAQGVICLPKPKQCFKDGHFSYRWTRRIFGI